MQRKTGLIVGGAALTAALIGGTAGISQAAGAAGADDAEKPITGPALEAASAAALRHTGGGRVTETEVGDEDGYYEVEVTLANGRQVDVHLDRDLKVLSSKADHDGRGHDGPGDDRGRG
jgi:uncharacterized membrane protein YkoI